MEITSGVLLQAYLGVEQRKRFSLGQTAPIDRTAAEFRSEQQPGQGQNTLSQRERAEDAVTLRLRQDPDSGIIGPKIYTSGGVLDPQSVDENVQKQSQTEVEQLLQELKHRDREVRSHEQAHKSALGPHAAGGIKLEYTRGPDGNRYATSGEVPVNLSEAETPEKTIEKMETVRRAALAPAEPSAADRSVASQASQLEAQARAEQAQEKRDENTEDAEEKEAPASLLNIDSQLRPNKGAALEIVA